MTNYSLNDFLSEWHSEADTIEVLTSGSTGTPKRITVSKSRMLASARMTCDFFDLQRGDSALLCMSLDYIAGKMMVVRSLERGLNLVTTSPSSPSEGFPRIDFAAMVPLQVYRLLHNEADVAWLKSIRILLLGGGSIDNALEEQLKTFPGKVYSSYGMTETLSHIALRRIGDEWYTPLRGIVLSTDSEGCLIIDAPHLCAERLFTNDIVTLLPDGRFKVLGRRDNVVCSGGIKIHIEQVEEDLREKLGNTFCLTKRADSEYGEVLIMLSTQVVDDGIFNNIPRYHKPKQIIYIDALPLTETGKINRKEAWRIAQTA